MWMLCFECSSYSHHIRISPSCDIKQIKEYKKCDKMSVQNSLHPFFGFWFTALNIWNFGMIYMNKNHWRHMSEKKRRNIEILLTDTLQVWIPKMIFSAFITVPSSKLRMAWTMSSYLNMSQHIHSKFNHQHLLQVIIYNFVFYLK